MRSVLCLSAAALLFATGHEPPSDIRLPLEGITKSNLRDTYNEVHFGHPHEALDLPSPKGAPVHAVVGGTIRKLFLSKPGGKTIYQFDEHEIYCYYYAHLDRYAETLHEGQRVKRGDVIGFVGTTGNADPKAPHLHFAIFELDSRKQWWNGKPINPFPSILAAAEHSK